MDAEFDFDFFEFDQSNTVSAEELQNDAQNEILMGYPLYLTLLKNMKAMKSTLVDRNKAIKKLKATKTALSDELAKVKSELNVAAADIDRLTDNMQIQIERYKDEIESLQTSLAASESNSKQLMYLLASKQDATTPTQVSEVVPEQRQINSKPKKAKEDTLKKIPSKSISTQTTSIATSLKDKSDQPSRIYQSISVQTDLEPEPCKNCEEWAIEKVSLKNPEPCKRCQEWVHEKTSTKSPAISEVGDDVFLQHLVSPVSMVFSDHGELDTASTEWSLEDHADSADAPVSPLISEAGTASESTEQSLLDQDSEKSMESVRMETSEEVEPEALSLSQLDDLTEVPAKEQEEQSQISNLNCLEETCEELQEDDSKEPSADVDDLETPVKSIFDVPDEECSLQKNAEPSQIPAAILEKPLPADPHVDGQQTNLLNGAIDETSEAMDSEMLDFGQPEEIAPEARVQESKDDTEEMNLALKELTYLPCFIQPLSPDVRILKRKAALVGPSPLSRKVAKLEEAIPDSLLDEKTQNIIDNPLSPLPFSDDDDEVEAVESNNFQPLPQNDVDRFRKTVVLGSYDLAGTIYKNNFECLTVEDEHFCPEMFESVFGAIAGLSKKVSPEILARSLIIAVAKGRHKALVVDRKPFALTSSERRVIFIIKRLEDNSERWFKLSIAAIKESTKLLLTSKKPKFLHYRYDEEALSSALTRLITALSMLAKEPDFAKGLIQLSCMYMPHHLLTIGSTLVSSWPSLLDPMCDQDSNLLNALWHCCSKRSQGELWQILRSIYGEALNPPNHFDTTSFYGVLPLKLLQPDGQPK